MGCYEIGYGKVVVLVVSSLFGIGIRNNLFNKRVSSPNSGP